MLKFIILYHQYVCIYVRLFNIRLELSHLVMKRLSRQSASNSCAHHRKCCMKTKPLLLETLVL